MNNLVNNMRCKVGLHPFGEWIFIEGQYCKRKRTCTVCGNIQTEVKHDWGKIEFIEEGNCEKLRRCKRCSEVKPDSRRIEHDWGKIEFTEEGSCEKLRRCKRCSEVKPDSRRIEHDWNKSRENIFGESCITAIYCIRCHEEKIGSRETTHSFKEGDFLSKDDCILERQCSECGKIDKITKHDMDNLYLTEHSCETTYGCKRCGYNSKGILAKTINEFNKIYKSHTWTEKDWVYVNESDMSDCRMQRHCPRCGEFDKRILRHDWISENEIGCISQKRCKRCNKIEKDKANHQWNAWKHVANRPCSETRNCVRCGAYETRETHAWNIEYVPSKEAAEGIAILRLIGELQKNNSEKLAKAFTLKQRLQDRQEEQSQYGTNEMIRTELSQIKTSLNHLAVEELQTPLHELVGRINFVQHENGLYIIVDNDQKQVQFCGKCGANRKMQ